METRGTRHCMTYNGIFRSKFGMADFTATHLSHFYFSRFFSSDSISLSLFRCKMEICSFESIEKILREDSFNPMLGKMRSFRDCTISQIIPRVDVYAVSEIAARCLANVCSPTFEHVRHKDLRIVVPSNRRCLFLLTKGCLTILLFEERIESIQNYAIPRRPISRVRNHSITLHDSVCTILAYLAIYDPRNATFHSRHTQAT